MLNTGHLLYVYIGTGTCSISVGPTGQLINDMPPCLLFLYFCFEQVRSLEAELATTGLRAKDAERELKSLRATVESDRREVGLLRYRCRLANVSQVHIYTRLQPSDFFPLKKWVYRFCAQIG